MINLELFHNKVKDENGNLYPIYKISIYDKMNMIIGLSGSGKTYFVDNLDQAINGSPAWSYKCDIPVIVIKDADTIKMRLQGITNNLIVIDERIVKDLRQKGILNSLRKSPNYFIICDRTSLIKMDMNVNSVYEFKSRKLDTKRVYDTVKAIKLSKTNVDKNSSILNDIDFLVTEDSESGLIFWKNTLSKLTIPKFKKYGNGEVYKHIIYLLKKYNGTVLVILDYDQGAITMRKILTNNRIDKSRIVFMKMECFEEIICNSEFILGKFPELRDRVLNYEEYMNYKYSSTLVHYCLM